MWTSRHLVRLQTELAVCNIQICHGNGVNVSSFLHVHQNCPDIQNTENSLQVEHPGSRRIQKSRGRGHLRLLPHSCMDHLQEPDLLGLVLQTERGSESIDPLPQQKNVRGHHKCVT